MLLVVLLSTMYGRTPSLGVTGREVKPGLAVVVHEAGEEVVGEPEVKPGLNVGVPLGDHPHPHPVGLLGGRGAHSTCSFCVSMPTVGPQPAGA